MKYNLLLTAVFLSIIIYANINEMDGIVGLTKKDGGTGCLCHNILRSDTVQVWIEGPDSVFVSDSAEYKLFMSGGPAVVGGFDLAVDFGLLQSADSLTHIEFNDLTHSLPKQFVNDTVIWNFIYNAPDSILTDTLYATGNSCNGDSIPTDIDQWNHAQNFLVKVVDVPVTVQNNLSQPEDFALYQNYPNPFNPSTKIKFTVPQDERRETRNVTLKVYDVIGNEIATLLNEEKTAGEYEVEFNAESLSSGIYIYKLSAGNYSSTKKMILMK